jgi:outer membrane protein
MYKMSKRALIACICLLPLPVFAAENTPEAKAPVVTQTAEAAPAAAELKPAPVVQKARIGYVDLGRIAAESNRGKALKALLTARRETLQGKIDGKKKSIEKLKTTISTKIETMTPQQREAKSKEFRKKVEDFQSFAQNSEEELVALQGKETKKLYDAVEQESAAHGKANGYAAIVVKKELLYLGNSVEAQDVTDVLITALNQADAKK